jgi:hypothetical protein
MNSFSFNRCGKVLRWLVSVNRVNLLGLIAGFTFFIFLLQMATFIFGSFEQVVPFIQRSADFGAFLIPFALLIIASNAFTNFTSIGTKQQRGTFLTIPASNLEKYLALIVYMVVACGLSIILGYILGDDGSGGVLGKHFLHDLYKGVLSENIRLEFEREYGLTMADVIQRVYREPMPNRFLASLAPFIHRHLSDPAVRCLVINNFRDFFRYNIRPYGLSNMKVSFVGSIAWHFREQLAEAAQTEGFSLGAILKSPIEGLLHYHLQSK